MTRLEQGWAADVLTAFTEDEESGLTPRAGEVDYVSAFRRMRRGSTTLARVGLRTALWLVALAPLWLLGRVATFSALPAPERTELLIRLLAHRSFVVRELTLLLKLTAAMALLGTSSVRSRSGYDNVRPKAAITATAASDARVHLPLAARPALTTSQPAADAQPMEHSTP